MIATAKATLFVRLGVGVALLVSAHRPVAGEPGNATQAGGIGERSGNLLQPRPKVRPNPYTKLFKVPDLRTTTPVPPETSRPRVVCGMTLIPIDPDIDPKIYVEPRRDGTRYSIRAVPPPICK